MHIIEELLAERARSLTSKAWLWPVMRPAVYKALGYKTAVTMADHVEPMSGHDCFSYVSGEIGINVDATGLEHVPESGPLIIVSNHPTGLADGLFMHHILETRRPRHMFMANADALRLLPNAHDIILPVEWIEAKRTAAKTKQTLKDMKTAISQNKCIIIFPSGRLAIRKGKKMIERPWMSTAAAFAKKHNVPVVPAYISAKNSWLYYAFCNLKADELRDITLFREMFNKGKETTHVKFAPPIQAADLPQKSKDSTQFLKEAVERLAPDAS